jgi:hypothetical protein
MAPKAKRTYAKWTATQKARHAALCRNRARPMNCDHRNHNEVADELRASVSPSLALLFWQLRVECNFWVGIPAEWFSLWLHRAVKKEKANLQQIRLRLWHGDKDFSNTSSPERRECFQQFRRAILAHLDRLLAEEKNGLPTL